MSELFLEVPPLRGIYPGKVRARLVPRGERYDRMTIRPVWRLVIDHDGDGNVIRMRRDVVRTARGKNDEPRPMPRNRDGSFMTQAQREQRL